MSKIGDSIKTAADSAKDSLATAKAKTTQSTAAARAKASEAYETLSNQDKKTSYDNPFSRGGGDPFANMFNGRNPFQSGDFSSFFTGRNESQSIASHKYLTSG